MKHALVIPGGPRFPDPDKAAAFGSLFYDARTVDRAFMDAMRARPAPRPTPGIQIDPSWDGLDAATLATTAHTRLVDLGCPTTQPCPVLFDIEFHDPGYVLEWLRAWRQVRPTRQSYWTLEPLQGQPPPGGWITDELVAAVNADRYLRVVVQLYRGGMSPVSERAAVGELVARGFSGGKVAAFYSPLFPEAGDGIVFNFDALP